ncbi:MAG: NUDIX domain-containing protein [Candidatus Sungiibacteriota bacterium]
MKRDYGVFQVGLKILLRKGDKVLLLRMNDDDNWLDLPGGRIDNVEYRTPLEKIIAREVREELGPKVKYVLGKARFHFRRLRRKGANPAFVFLVVYDAQWKAGEVKLSSEHSSYEWIDPKTHILKRSDFGQEEECRAFKKYFAAARKKH